MDLIRSCYIGKMILNEGDPPVSVRWYRCGPEAVPFPGQHCFGSLNDDDTPGSPLVGEQRGPKKWDAGMRPAGLNGNGLIVGTPFEFGNGSPPFNRRSVWSVAEEPSLPLCRELIPEPNDLAVMPLYYRHRCGRLRFAENTKLGGLCEVVSPCAMFPADPICDCCIPFTIFAHFNATFACPSIAGKTVKLIRHRFDPPEWVGSISIPSSPTGRLWVIVRNLQDGSPIPWEISWDTTDAFSSGVGQTGQDFAQCDEFELQFNNAFDDLFCSPGRSTIVLVDAKP